MNQKIFYFSSTHWDREWYKPFQYFRFMLVKMIDELIEALENDPEFGVFHLDGQTIVLEDYLAVNSQNRERLTALIQSNRIKIGPWYCMPDEFLVSGESLIRNLHMGKTICDTFETKPWGVGYVCDIFGHIAQMPQIFLGFGIQNTAFWRGLSDKNKAPYFLWESPDGSFINAFKIRDWNGYGSFSIDVTGIKARGVSLDADSAEFKEKAKKYIDEEISRSDLPICVLMDGMDHEPVHEKTPAYIKEIQKIYPKAEVYHTDLCEMFEELKKYRDKLPHIKGEMYEPATENSCDFVITHTLSSRVRLKQSNDFCETLLTKSEEPLSVLAQLQGITVNPGYSDISWKYLLKNHPHDSICGCSVDRVHRDMEYRFAQVEEIYQAIKTDVTKKISDGFQLLKAQGGYITVINTLPRKVKRSLTLQIPFEPDFPKYQEPFGYEGICNFILSDKSGKEIPYSIKNIETNYKCNPFSEVAWNSDLYTVEFNSELLPFGFTSFQVTPAVNPTRYWGSLLSGRNCMKNELLEVQINNDGTISIKDFKTGKIYENLLTFIDDGEIGDGWNSVRPKINKTVVASEIKSISVLCDTPELCEIEIKSELNVPNSMTYLSGGVKRADNDTAIKAVTVVKLCKNDRFVSVCCKIDNTATGHRLRLLMPVKTDKSTYNASQAFTFVERSLGKDKKTIAYTEFDQLEKSMQGIVLKRNKDKTGLAFVGKYGFYECGVDDDQAGSIYITLLRSFDKVYYANILNDGKEQGIIDYEFCLVPLDEEITDTALQNMQDELKNPLIHFVTKEDKTYSQIAVSENVCVSALKPAFDGSGDIILRLFNPSNKAETATISFGFELTTAFGVDFNEEVTPLTLSVEKNEIHTELLPMKIVTVRIKK